MKILHISTSDQNGAGMAAVRIHNSLLAKGIESKLLCAKRKNEMDSIVEFKQPISKKIVLFFYSIFRKFGIELNEISALNNKIMEQLEGTTVFYTTPITNYDLSTHPLVKEADIIHLHWVANFVDYPSFFKNVKKPIVWTLHDEGLYYGIFHYRGMLDLYIDRVREMEEKCHLIKYNSIQNSLNLTILSLSSKMLEFSKKQAIVANRKHVLIHNSVNPLLYKPFNKQSAREYFNIPINNKVLFFVCDGINDPRKGIKELVQAIEHLNLPNIKLVAVGGDKINFKATVDIQFLGYISDEELLSKAYSAADLFVLPSFQEAFAQTPLEAMACGIPVVMFPCSGSNDLIDETNGIIAKDFTVEALKNAISEGLSTIYDAGKVRKTILDRFTPEIIAEQYIKVYNDVLNII